MSTSNRSIGNRAAILLAGVALIVAGALFLLVYPGKFSLLAQEWV